MNKLSFIFAFGNFNILICRHYCQWCFANNIVPPWKPIAKVGGGGCLKMARKLKKLFSNFWDHPPPRKKINKINKRFQNVQLDCNHWLKYFCQFHFIIYRTILRHIDGTLVADIFNNERLSVIRLREVYLKQMINFKKWLFLQHTGLRKVW